MGGLKSRQDSVRGVKERSESRRGSTETNPAIIQRVILTLFFYLLSIFSFPVFSLAALTTPESSYQPSPYQIKDSLSRLGKEASLAVAVINGLSVDPFSGSTNLNIPLFTPSARRGMQPNLVLNYSTSNPNGSLGPGWKLELGYIERSTKDGIPSYTQDDKFIFSLAGNVSELVAIGGNDYLPKRQPESYKFSFTDGYWQAKDKAGTTYYFGNRYDSVGVESSPWSDAIFRWYLVKVKDTLGNYLTIDYESGRGGSPSGIYYGRHKTNSGDINELYLEFLYEKFSPDEFISTYRPGFHLIKYPQRINSAALFIFRAT